jgi:hypothetical protein
MCFHPSEIFAGFVLLSEVIISHSLLPGCFIGKTNRRVDLPAESLAFNAHMTGIACVNVIKDSQ